MGRRRPDGGGQQLGDEIVGDGVGFVAAQGAPGGEPGDCFVHGGDGSGKRPFKPQRALRWQGPLREEEKKGGLWE